MANLYLFGKPDGKVYKIENDAFVQVGTKPPTEAMFLAEGNDVINTTLIQEEDLITVYFYSDLDTVYGNTFTAIAHYVPKTVVQLEDFIIEGIANIVITAGSMPTNANVRILYSANGGASWSAYSFATNSWSVVPLANISTAGMTFQLANQLTGSEYGSLVGSSNIFRVAYYLEQANSTDQIRIDQIRINFGTIT